MGLKLNKSYKNELSNRIFYVIAVLKYLQMKILLEFFPNLFGNPIVGCECRRFQCFEALYYNAV